jgi:hypothetical protein
MHRTSCLHKTELPMDYLNDAATLAPRQAKVKGSSRQYWPILGVSLPGSAIFGHQQAENTMQSLIS